MSEQETSESDKLIIVESGKNRRGAATTASSSSSESSLNFTRQIIGRHVIYKSADGVKLRSLAEARRYFKQKGQVLVDSEFDFSPPALDTEAKRNTSSLDSTSAAASKSVRGRPKRPATNSPKLSPSKSTALSRRKELVDDLKTIRDSLKDDENEGNNLEAPSTSKPSTKSPRGRPKRQIQPHMETGESAEGTLPDVESISTKDETSPEGSKGRPTRQRRPNQRYTDLISETESSRKKPRKESAGAEPVVRKDLPAETVNPAAKIPIIPGIKAIKPSPMKGTKRGFHISLEKKGATSRQSKSSLPRQYGLQPFTPMATETFGNRSDSLSPLPAGGFEAPPEFVEMQEQPSHQEANVLPAIPSSSLLYTPAVPASSDMAPAVQPTIVSASMAPSKVAFKRLDMEPPPKQRQLYGKPNSAKLISPVEHRRIAKPIRRGPKAIGSEAPALGSVWQKFEHPVAEEPFSGRRGQSTSRRYDHGSRGIRGGELSPDIEEQPHYGSNLITAHYAAPRGLAKLQQRGSKRTMTIGRYGATTSAASVMLRDPPPQLEPYGGGEPVIERSKIQKQGKVQQRGARQSETDSALFCHLPPEIVGDHCYGRPEPTAGTSGGQKIVGIAVSAATKTGNGQPYGSSPPPLLRVESQRRSLPSDQSDFGSTSPSYQSQRYRATSSNFDSYQNMEVANFTSDLGSSSGGPSATLGGQQVAILGDKLPANILEEDDGDIGGELVTSVSIH